MQNHYNRYTGKPACRQTPCFWMLPEIAFRRHCDGTLSGCYRCGKPFHRNHLFSCSAKHSQCFKCGKLGHFAKVCFSTSTRSYCSFPRKTYPLDSIVNISTTQNSVKGTGRTCPQMNRSVGSAEKLSANKDSTGRVNLNSSRTNCPTNSVGVAIPLKSKLCLKTKSASKRRRDSKRIQEFFKRKRAFEALPFGDLTAEEISRLQKSSVVHDQSSIIKNQSKKLKTKFCELLETCVKLRIELNTVKQEKLSTEKQLINSGNQISALKSEITKLKDQKRNKFPNNVSQGQTTTSHLDRHPILPFPTPPVYFQYQNSRPRNRTNR